MQPERDRWRRICHKGAKPDAAQPGAGEKKEHLAVSAALTELRPVSFHVFPEVCQTKAWHDANSSQGEA